MKWLGGIGRRPWLIVPLAAALHLTYGLGLLAGEYDVARITAVYLIGKTFGAITIATLIIVGLVSLIPMVVTMRAERIHLCLWPQQTLLFLMAASALSASVEGQYPDGTIKNGLFILIDQSWTIYIACAHFAATLRNAMYGHD